MPWHQLILKWDILITTKKTLRQYDPYLVEMLFCLIFDWLLWQWNNSIDLPWDNSSVAYSP